MTDEAITPDQIATFADTAAKELGELHHTLTEASARAEQIKQDGENRLADLNRQIAADHNAALDAEDAARQAYNARREEILGRNIITSHTLEILGFKKSASRRGRKPAAK